jgi:hypothetical protein
VTPVTLSSIGSSHSGWGLFCVQRKEKIMNRQILEQPFGPEQIKQREGNFGKMLDYIEGHAVIQRLNDAFEGEWSFTMTKYEVMQETDEVLVIGQLNAGGIVKSQFGSSRITRAKETGDIISLADDLKAAATDALKKAATLLGVGLHLYRNELPNGAHRNGYSRPNGGDRNGGNGNNTNGGNENSRPYGSNGNGGHAGNDSSIYCRAGNGGNGNGRLTSKQYRFILKMVAEKGQSTAELDQKCLERYGTVAQYLSKGDASAVIEQLLAG